MTTLLQTAGGDIAVTNGRLHLVDGVTEKAQKIRNRFALFRGEWFLDLRAGTPWWERVFGIKNPDLRIAGRMLRDIVLSVTGIVDVEEEVITLSSRHLRYEYTAIADDGERIQGVFEDTFILDEK